MDEKYKLLEQVHYDSSMAVHTTEKLLKDLENKDNKIKSYLYEILDEYKDFETESRKLLELDDRKIDDPNIMAKIGSSMGISKEVMKDNSDSAIADMMIQGVSMGSIEIEKKLKEYDKDLDEEHKKLGKKFLKFQQKTIDNLKKYL